MCNREKFPLAENVVLPGMTDETAAHMMPHLPPDEPVAIDYHFNPHTNETEYYPRQNVGTSEQVQTFLKSQPVTSSNPKDIAASGKCPLHLIPPIAETEIAWVLSYGAEKYGKNNWRDEKISLTNYLGAMRRHINRVLDGEDSDAESGLLHLAHVAATACIVMDAMEHDCVIDDRPEG